LAQGLTQNGLKATEAGNIENSLGNVLFNAGLGGVISNF